MYSLDKQAVGKIALEKLKWGTKIKRNQLYLLWVYLIQGTVILLCVVKKKSDIGYVYSHF